MLSAEWCVGYFSAFVFEMRHAHPDPMPSTARQPSQPYWVSVQKQEKLDLKLFEVISTNGPLVVEEITNLLDAGANVNDIPVEQAGRRPLHEAAHQSSAQACRILLHRGAEVNATSDMRTTALQECLFDPALAIMGDKGGKTAIEKQELLFEHIGQVNEVVAALVEAGANPNTQDDRGNSPMHCAVVGKFEVALQILLQHGGDPMLKDHDGITPWSIEHERGGHLIALLQAGRAAMAVDDVMAMANGRGRSP